MSSLSTVKMRSKILCPSSKELKWILRDQMILHKFRETAKTPSNCESSFREMVNNLIVFSVDVADVIDPFFMMRQSFWWDPSLFCIAFPPGSVSRRFIVLWAVFFLIVTHFWDGRIDALWFLIRITRTGFFLPEKKETCYWWPPLNVSCISLHAY